MLGTGTMLWPPLIYHGLSLSISYLHFSHMQNIHLLSRPPKISSNMAAIQCSEYISSSGSGLDVNEVAWVQLFSVWKLRDLKIHYLSPSLHPPPEPHLCVRKRGGLTAIDSPIPRGRKPRARGRHRSLTFLKRSHAPKAPVPGPRGRDCSPVGSVSASRNWFLHSALACTLRHLSPFPRKMVYICSQVISQSASCL